MSFAARAGRVLPVVLTTALLIACQQAGDPSAGSSSGAGESPPAAEGDGQTLAQIQESKTAVAGHYNQAPFAFKEEGAVTGIEVELTRQILGGLGVETVEPFLVEFSSLIPGLQAQRFDLMVGDVYIRPDRCEQVLFGNPHLLVGEGLAVQAGNPKNIHSYDDIIADESIVVAISASGVEPEILRTMGLSEERMSAFPDGPTAIAALKAGRVDAIAYGAITIAALVENDESGEVERVEDFTQPTDPETGDSLIGYAGAAFRLGDEDLRDAWNEQLAELHESGALLELQEQFGLSSTELPAADVTADDLCSG